MDLVTYDGYLQRLRRKDFPQLLGTTYLDHAGTTVYAQSLLDLFHEDMRRNLFGNPHSASPSSDLSTQRINRVRKAVLDYFNADTECFDVVFVANATAAIKLVMQSFQTQGFWYGYHKDAHSSIVGGREVATHARCFVSDQDVEDWIKCGRGETTTENFQRLQEIGLFAYPAQSNMTGHRLPYSWSQRIRSSYPNCYTLLDAASYLTTGRVDLRDREAAPDFIALSFYKIFGFPDLGALIVRKDAYDILKTRKYFGGGTVDMIIDLDDDWHAMKTETLHDVLEDGTLPFHSIVALQHAFTVHSDIFGTAAQISRHVSHLSSSLHRELGALRHLNGNPVVEFHLEQHSRYDDLLTQGPILAFSILDADGQYVGKSKFEMLAIACDIQLRTGGVCNPGGIASMLHLKSWELRRNFSEGVRCGNEIDVIGGKPTGIIRISLGAMSTSVDVQVFVHFVRFFFGNTPGQAQDCAGDLRRPAAEIGNQRPDRDLNREKGTCQLSIVPVPKAITPVQGCESYALLAIPGKSAKEAYDSYATWDSQWRLVDPDKHQPLTGPTMKERIAGLRIDLQPHTGLLRLSSDRSTVSSSNETTTDVGPKLDIDLWSLPPSDNELSPGKSLEFWDIYREPRISNWLTAHLDTPATLARRRGLNDTQWQQANRCVVFRCQAQCTDPSQLRNHNETVHRPEFEQVLRDSHIDRGAGARERGGGLEEDEEDLPALLEDMKIKYVSPELQAPIFGFSMLRKSITTQPADSLRKQKRKMGLRGIFTRPKKDAIRT